MIINIKNLILTCLILQLFSCAEQVSPNGGAKDIIPPKTLKLSPENYSTNFNGKEIEIVFDEFVKINSGGGNIIVSPKIRKPLDISLIGKKLKISFQEELKSNTTYIINLENSIKDFNEGNEMKNFKYVFSTGSTVDSLQITGQVTNSFDKSIEKEVLVGLFHNNIDSLLSTKPIYFTKTNKNGAYSLQNIKEGEYLIAALKDKNLNHIFDQETEHIGFSTEPVLLDKDEIKINLTLFKNTKDLKIKTHKNDKNNFITINYNKPFLNYSLKTDSAYNIFHKQSLDKKNILIYYGDSIESIDFYIKPDTNNIDTQSTNLIKTSSKLFVFEIETEKRENNILIKLLFPFPIISFDPTGLSLTTKNDSILYTPTWNNTRTKLTLTTSGTPDTITLNSTKKSFTSFHNNFSRKKEQTLSHFPATSKLELSHKTPHKNTIMEVYNAEKELQNTLLVSRETTTLNLLKGKYFIRIYSDDNRNKYWDSGLFHVKQQPEKTLLYRAIEITDWDKEIELDY